MVTARPRGQLRCTLTVSTHGSARTAARTSARSTLTRPLPAALSLTARSTSIGATRSKRPATDTLVMG